MHVTHEPKNGQSAMGKYEMALSNCDTAVELRLANSDVVSSDSIKEAHLVRAEALLLDMGEPLDFPVCQRLSCAN